MGMFSSLFLTNLFFNSERHRLASAILAISEKHQSGGAVLMVRGRCAMRAVYVRAPFALIVYCLMHSSTLHLFIYVSFPNPTRPITQLLDSNI